MDETPEVRLPLSVDGLLIRRVVPDDARDLYAYLSDPEVARYQFWGPYTDDQVAAMIDGQAEVGIGDPGVALLLAAVLDGAVIGDCQFTVTSVDDGQAEIGFSFNPKFTGRGLATRSITAILGFGFMQLGMHRIVASTDVRNERSWKLMERVGMRREAHFIHDSFSKGAWMDAYVYAMLADEWMRTHPELVAAVALDPND